MVRFKAEDQQHDKASYMEILEHAESIRRLTFGTDTYNLEHPEKHRNFGDRAQELTRSMLIERVPGIDILDAKTEQDGIMRDMATILHHHGHCATASSSKERVRQFRKELKGMIQHYLGHHEKSNDPSHGHER